VTTATSQGTGPIVLAVIPSLSGNEDELRALVRSLEDVGMSPVVVATGRKLDRSLELSAIPHSSPKMNAGFGATIAHVAKDRDWEWLAVVNDDVTVETELLARCLDGVLGEAPAEPLLAYLDPGPSRPMPGLWTVVLSIGSLASILGRLRRVPEPTISGNANAQNYFRPFSFTLISRGLWDALGGFDGAFVYTYEDVDFARRAALAGAEIVFAEDAGVVHKKSATGRRYIDRVLPVGVWSACIYLEKWGTPRLVARGACLLALAFRLASVPVSSAPRRKHVIGIFRAMAAIVNRTPPRLPDYEAS